MVEIRSLLFQGDTLLQRIADDEREPDGSLTRISRTRHSTGDSVTRVQQALLTWRSDVLAKFGADGDYGDESAGAVRTFKIDELGVPAAEVIDDVGPLTVKRLDEIQEAAEAPPVPPPVTVFIRRSAWTLQQPTIFDPITLAYAKAVRAMQARPATDPTSWTFQAAIHGSFATQPAGVRWNECQHQQWFFLAWHRMYVHFFERIVRAAVIADGGPADFAIPYWDYDGGGGTAALPPAFRERQLPDGSPNPLFVDSPQRSAVMNAGGTIPPDARTSAAAMAALTFTGAAPAFGGARSAPTQFLNFASVGALESTPHNVVHPLVGGNVGTTERSCRTAWMSKPSCAALDPIFWLHHANIDRLWNRWLASGAGRAHPSDSDWRTERFTFHDETGAQVTIAVDGVLDTEAQLRYRYDDLASFTPPSAPVTPAPVPSRLVAATEQPLELVGSPESVVMALPADALEALGSVRQGAARALLNVEDIDATSDPGVPYGVYVVLPGGDRRHVGNVSLFGIEQMSDPDQPHEGATGFRHTFDVTDLLTEIGDLSALGEGEVTVAFAPLAPEPPEGFEPPPEEAEAAPRLARIGRVSLFVG